MPFLVTHRCGPHDVLSGPDFIEGIQSLLVAGSAFCHARIAGIEQGNGGEGQRLAALIADSAVQSSLCQCLREACSYA